MEARKQRIKDYALNLGVYDMGVAGMGDLPGTSRVAEILPQGKSLLVMVVKEVGSPYTQDPMVAGNGRQDGVNFIRHCSYMMALFMERNFGAKVVTLPYSHPMTNLKGKFPMGPVSLRHAAVAAGLGTLGRHNLLIHPKYGTRIILFGLITDLDLHKDQPLNDNLCIDCDLCVKNCPSQALREEGKTDVARCLSSSQPTGMMANAKFWNDIIEADHDTRAKMLRSPEYFNIMGNTYLGGQYFCFNCFRSCPVGVARA